MTENAAAVARAAEDDSGSFSIRRCFDLTLDRGMVAVALRGTPGLIAPGTLDDFRFVNKPSNPGAVLHLSGGPGRRGMAGLFARSALLAAPPVHGRAAPFYSLTLSAAAGPRPGDWPTRILAGSTAIPPALIRRAAGLRRQVVESRAIGPWAAAPPAIDTAGRVIVVAAARPAATVTMLQHAMARHAATRIVLLAPAEDASTRAARRLGAGVLVGNVDPWAVCEPAAWVNAEGDAPAGIIALLAGTPVLAHSPGPLAHTTQPDCLAAAVLLLGARYADPFHGVPATPEAFLDMVCEWRRQRARTAAIGSFAGISFWKKRRMAEFVAASPPLSFHHAAPAAVAAANRRGGAVAVWPSRSPASLDAAAARAAVPIIRVEDGFIRSAGLGADFLPPLSIVLDSRGIFYDATRPSDLETLLETTRFTPNLLARAAALRARLIRQRVTKYNLDSGACPPLPAHGRIILVPGQVSDDRSVLLGGGGRLPGLDLLRRVRARAPDAFVIYKPHPDVEAGHRNGAVSDAEALRHADLVVRDAPITALLDAVDEVHTLTSLTGFEALLRGKPVTTYGHPFYAGWGLTTDDLPIPRRTARPGLDGLVAATLILYPHYFDPQTALPCGPEIILDRLAGPQPRPTPLVLARRLQGRAGRTLQRVRDALHAGQPPGRTPSP